MKHHRISTLSAAAVTFALAGSMAHAEMMTLAPSQEAIVRGGSNSGNVQSTATALPIKNDTGSTNNTTRKLYLEFDLTAFQASGDTADSASVIFDIFNLESSAVDGDLTFWVLNPGSDDWNQSTITFDNAPANTPAGDVFLEGTMANQMTQIGSANINATDNPIGSTFAFSNAALTNLVNTFPESSLTIGVTYEENLTVGIASTANPDALSGPVLSIVTSVPEPASLSLLAIGGLLLLPRKRG